MLKTRNYLFLFGLLFFLIGEMTLSPAALAQKSTLKDQNEIFQKVDFKQHIGEKIDLSLPFTDENGSKVTLQKYFGEKPVILTPVYYECPMLCTLVLNGVVKALQILKFVPGQEFELVTFSFNPKETAALAKNKKMVYIGQLDNLEAAKGWHFLTGSEESIAALTEAIGFKAVYDAASKEFAHAAGILVLTPEGKISHYFYGIEYSPKDLRLALIQSAKNKIGTVIDQLLLLCYHYDPATGKYGLVIMNGLRVGGFLTVFILIWFITKSLKTDKQNKIKS